MDQIQTLFFSRVDVVGECWEWTGRKDSHGYALVHMLGSEVRANRMAWILKHGEIEDGLFVCHHCDNPSCIRPDHLFVGTPGDNSRDMVAKGRHAGWSPAAMARRVNGGTYYYGEAHPRSVLSKDNVISIRERYAAGGVTYKQLASEFGVHETSIGKIVRGEKWKVLD